MVVLLGGVLLIYIAGEVAEAYYVAYGPMILTARLSDQQPTCTLSAEIYSRVHHSLCWVAEQGSIRPIVLGCAVVRNTRRGLGCCVPPFVCYVLQSCLTAAFPSPSDPVPDGKVEKSSINHN